MAAFAGGNKGDFAVGGGNGNAFGAFGKLAAAFEHGGGFVRNGINGKAAVYGNYCVKGAF